MFERQTNRSRPITPYKKRHSTIGAAEFFHGGISWMDIPSRLQMLVFHLQKDSHLAATETRSITLSKDPMEARLIALTAAISNSAPFGFWSECKTFFVKMISWHIWRNREVNDDEEESMEEFDISSTCEEDDEFFCQLFGDKSAFVRNLQTLQYLNSQNQKHLDILAPALDLALHEIITSYISSKISSRYNQPDLYADIIEWKNKVLITLLQKLSIDTATIDERLDQTISDCYCQTRQKEIFDMIADYPDSKPSFVDLNRALQKTHKMNSLIKALKDALKRRLLHPGAQTGQILQVYMDMIQVLRIMDPSDTLFNSASDEIRSYLRGRSDTVRCIITSLIDKDSKSDLYEELQKPFSIPLDHYPDSDDDEQPVSLNWCPASSIYFQRVSGAMNNSSPPGKSADLLAMLVRIYGSNDLFVDEYRMLLADKLLASTNFNTDEEVQNLELLMLRFGEASMRKCDIMLKDIGDSKRISNNINSTIQINTKNSPQLNSTDNEMIVDAAIISHIFWPALQKQDISFHPCIQAKLDEFSDEYHKYKTPRKLVWFQQLGQVELELEIVGENGEVSTKAFTCSPIHANLISYFEEHNGRWSAKELSQETNLSEDVIRKKMNLWVNSNLISSTRSGGEIIYELISFDGEIDNNGDSFYDDDDGLVVSLSGKEEEEWQTIEAFIMGMLSNFGSLPLERIQNLLKTYAAGTEHGYKKSPHQLSAHLQQMCSQHKIEFGSDGQYKLIKK